MRAIVLSGGMATRLSPLSAYVPKALVPVANQAILAHELLALRAANVTEVGITYSPNTEALPDYFGDGSAFGVDITWLWEPVPRGTGGALRLQREFFGGEPALVVPGDIILQADLAAMMAQHQANPCGVTLVVAPRDLGKWTGDIVVANGIEGVSYHFKPKTDVGSNLGSCGTWIVDPATLDLIPEGFVDFSSDFLPRLPVPACTLGVYNAGNVYQRDFGEFWSFHAGNLEIISGRTHLSLPRAVACEYESSVARGPVLIGDDAIIEPGVALYGPTIIGQGAVVAADSQIVSSVVLPGGTVPPGTFLANAVFGDPARVLKVMMRYRNGQSGCLGRLVTARNPG